MTDYLIKNALTINEGVEKQQHILIKNGLIADFPSENDIISLKSNIKTLDATGLILIPGIIDDQVHFRDPGLTHKADISSESHAAVAGGITSFMEMPNTNPQTITQKELEKKFTLAADKSIANYSFYIGATNDNLDELLTTDPKSVCGIKIFMGSSTGNMLVNNDQVLNEIFKKARLLVATHCEDEVMIQNNTKLYEEKYGEEVPIFCHPLIRSAEACFKSSSYAVNLAKKHGTKLHILHISTARELALFDNTPLSNKKQITAEVCVHHLWFDEDDYQKLGTRIKWNPAIKTRNDREALLKAAIDDQLDVIATDHAPHTFEEKQNNYFNAPSGAPMVQHSLPLMLEMYKNGKISLTRIIDKMCHHPAILFNILNRGFLRKGYHADLVLVNLNDPWQVKQNNLLYKCKWSPLEDQVLQSKVLYTFVNGVLVYEKGRFNEKIRGQALKFNR